MKMTKTTIQAQASNMPPTKGSTFSFQGGRDRRRRTFCFFLTLLSAIVVGMSCLLLTMSSMASLKKNIVSIKTMPAVKIMTTETTTMMTTTKNYDDEVLVSTSFHSSFSSIGNNNNIILMEKELQASSLTPPLLDDRNKENEKKKKDDEEEEGILYHEKTDDDVSSNLDSSSKIPSSSFYSSFPIINKLLVESKIYYKKLIRPVFVENDDNRLDEESKVVTIIMNIDDNNDDSDIGDGGSSNNKFFGNLRVSSNLDDNQNVLLHDDDKTTQHVSTTLWSSSEAENINYNPDSTIIKIQNEDTPMKHRRLGSTDHHHNDRDDVHPYYYFYDDIDEFSYRLLQEETGGTSSSTSPICKNISDTFQTTYVLVVQGNESLFTDLQANLLASTFATTYNDQRNGNIGIGTGDTGTTTTVCDPLFRTITQIQVSGNISFTGVNNNQFIDNPLPIRPVRERRRQQRKLRSSSSPSAHYHDDDDEQYPSSSSNHGMNWNLWKSSHLEFEKIIKNLKEEERKRQQRQGGETTMMDHPPEERQLQILQEESQPQQQLQQQLNITSLDRMPYNSRVVLILLDIFGTCRGCQGQTQAFDLFDDISSSSSSSSPVVRHKGRRQQEKEEEKQEERHLQDNDKDNCICPADSVVGDSTDFETSFTSKVDDLRDNGEIEFIEQVEEVIPVLETKCPTKDQDFSTVFLVRNLIFSRSILFSLGIEGVQDVELLFRDIYNGISQQLCDLLYRAVSKTQLISIEQEEGSETVRMEFVVEATCRGDNCIDIGCIFDDVSSCGVDQRDRHLKNNIHDSNSSILVVPEEMTDNSLVGSSRLLKDDDDEERCFCRKGRAKRPPSPQEFQEAFQKGLDDITENNKLSSCQECSSPFDCQSGVCLTGRCAEADTQLLLNSCTCNSNGDCESGFCQNPSSFRGTCQGKLTSCQVCNNGEECLSGVCTAGKCAEAVDGKLKTGCECNSNLNCQTGRCVDDVINNIDIPGKCTEKISNTCNETCLSSTDCMSGLCGSVVCMPINGTLLPDRCLSTLRTECESGMIENNICIPASEVPSLEPSTHPTQGPTFQPSPAPNARPSHGPTTGPIEEPSTPPTLTPSTIPSSRPSTGPSFRPSMGPSQSPSTPPTSQPSQSPSISPTAAPSTSPSITPSNGATTTLPTNGPTATSPPQCGAAFGEASCPSDLPYCTFEDFCSADIQFAEPRQCQYDYSFPGTCGRCGADFYDIVCTDEFNPWCSGNNYCGGTTGHKLSCQPAYSIPDTCVRCGAAFGEASCPSDLPYCTFEDFCSADIQYAEPRQCQYGYSFSGTCGRCGADFYDIECTDEFNPWCSGNNYCGGTTGHQLSCQPAYSIPGTCTTSEPTSAPSNGATTTLPTNGPTATSPPQCGAAFGEASCPYDLPYCTFEDFCSADIQYAEPRQCQYDYSFPGTCGRCGADFYDIVCTDEFNPWCSENNYCGSTTGHESSCQPAYSTGVC